MKQKYLNISKKHGWPRETVTTGAIGGQAYEWKHAEKTIKMRVVLFYIFVIVNKSQKMIKTNYFFPSLLSKAHHSKTISSNLIC